MVKPVIDLSIKERESIRRVVAASWLFLVTIVRDCASQATREELNEAARAIASDIDTILTEPLKSKA